MAGFGNKPSFVRDKSGNIYRWEPDGAVKYRKSVEGLKSSRSVRANEAEISNPKKFGISNICPGGTPCLN